MITYVLRRNKCGYQAIINAAERCSFHAKTQKSTTLFSERRSVRNETRNVVKFFNKKLLKLIRNIFYITHLKMLSCIFNELYTRRFNNKLPK
jgi:hypothetical protein